jgi:hypothetical protein
VGVRRAAAALALAAAVLTAAALVPAGPAAAQDAVTAAQRDAQANRMFVEAVRSARRAESLYDAAERARLVREADALLQTIVDTLPETAIAVQLVTNQFIGDFDVAGFREQVRGLACDDPLATGCFLHRIELLLHPVEHPIAVPRWDWLSLAVAYHHLGQPERTAPILAPFVAAQRRSAAGGDADDDLFVARALALTGRPELALELTRRLDGCPARIYNLIDLARASAQGGDGGRAGDLVQEARDFADTRGCRWELGLVAQGLIRVGREADARTLFLNTVEQQFSRFREQRIDCCPPELAVAAADLADASLALRLLRTVQDDNPWTIPAVVGRLAGRGEVALALGYAEQVQDADVRAEAYAEIVARARAAGDARTAEDAYARLRQLTRPDAPGDRRPTALAQRAKAERLVEADASLWRRTFASAINAADRGFGSVPRDFAVPLLAALVRIETGVPLLD